MQALNELFRFNEVVAHGDCLTWKSQSWLRARALWTVDQSPRRQRLGRHG